MFSIKPVDLPRALVPENVLSDTPYVCMGGCLMLQFSCIGTIIVTLNDSARTIQAVIIV